jgi:C-terminal processing protease CtpA/Prc
VQRVYPGTDAERKGIHARDNILSIDGQFLFELDAAAVDRKLRGPVGTSRQLGFPGSRTVDVLVDELLPLP